MMSSVKKLWFFKLSADATAPMKATPQSAGFDLCSAKDLTVQSKDRALVFTDLQIKLPKGCYGRIAPRSGLAVKSFIDIGAGVIDPDYTGNVGIVVFNFGCAEFQINKGDRIAQLICEKIHLPDIEESQDPIIATWRGSRGFGSSDNQ